MNLKRLSLSLLYESRADQSRKVGKLRWEQCLRNL